MTRPEAAPVAVAAAEDTRTGRSAWLVLAAVLPGMFMNVFDFFAVNVATPVLHRDLGSGPPALELIVGGYGLTFSLGLVTGGRLGDRYGRRRVFFAGMAAFTLASAASGLAPTSDILVIARLVQGAAAAMMVPQVLSIIRVSFPARERRIALGVYGMTIAAGQVSGQALGGILLSANILGLSWRPIFLVNVPVAALTFLFGFRSVPESRSPTRPSLDLAGVALLTLAAGLLTIPIVEGGALGWPLWCWLFLAAVPVSGAAFAWWEHRVRASRQPLVDLGLFRSRDFRRGLFVNVTLYATITSFFFVLGLYLQTGRGDSPMVAGLTFVPLAAGNFLGEPVEQRAGRALRPQHADRGGGLPGGRPPRAPRGVRARPAHGPGARRGDAVRPRAGPADPADHRRGAEPRPRRGPGGSGRRARHRPADVGDHRPGPGEPRLLRGRRQRAGRTATSPASGWRACATWRWRLAR